MKYVMANQVQNLIEYSEALGTAPWGGAALITADADHGVADTDSTADQVEDDDAAVAEYLSQAYTLTDSAIFHTFSIYIQRDAIPNTTRHCAINVSFSGSTTEDNYMYFDTSNGEIDGSSDSGSAVEAVIGSDGTNWWRFSLAAKSADAGNTTLTVYVYPAHGASYSVNVATLGSIICWGAQLVKGSVPGPYVKTTSAADIGLDTAMVAVEVTPEWNIKEKGKKIESRNRTLDGSEFVYKWGDYNVIDAPVSFVNSSARYQLNDWWLNNTELVWLKIDYERIADVTSCRIINKSTPISGYVKPYEAFSKGKIEIGTY